MSWYFLVPGNVGYMSVMKANSLGWGWYADMTKNVISQSVSLIIMINVRSLYLSSLKADFAPE